MRFGPDLWTPNLETTPGAAKARLQRYLSRQDFEELFPNRYGQGKWWPSHSSQIIHDYYGYDNLLSAIGRIANIVYIVKSRVDAGVPSNWNQQVIVLHKNNGTTGYVISQAEDFNASWNIAKPIDTQVVDMGQFLNHSNDNDNKREIATMLAHMTQETSGGTGVQGRIEYALWFNEETGYIGNNAIGYVDAGSVNYPPTPDKSYHGRGPKQLSWNYNYGLFSDIFYLDKSVLLDNPELIVQDGALGYMTAIAFYMTPQNPKISMWQAIDSDYQLSSSAISKGYVKGFGLTIVVINGAYEANFAEWQDPEGRVDTRIGAYRNICARNGANITGEKLDTAGMPPWT
jgi:hypothetical protein